MKVLTVLLLLASLAVQAQTQIQTSTYVDDKGIVRWAEDNSELCVMGTNYSVPFSYWNERESLGYDQRKAIDEDVYHIARLGLDGYRIHVWDDYLSDSVGNLQDNIHLDLFDYLLFKLKERDIKIFLTAMTQFESSGYGFASKWGGKHNLFTDTASYAVQANYLQQFVNHVNPYTGVAYKDDPDIIGFSIQNEPFHWKAPQLVSTYVSRMYNAIKSTGCDKPIFYNMGTCSEYHKDILATEIDGITLQWYPTGLTANQDQGGNYLPHVDEYKMPFAEALEGKPRFVYEFSPSDVGANSYLYPAMARSFREAGFQFAAHFAYDPMHAAYCNIEYKTHFLNLAYTPSRAIGMMIASEVFHRVPLGKSYGRYPENVQFDVFKLDYENDLAEMVTDEVFLYSNTTTNIPPKNKKLNRVAGVGSSSVVNYSGTGAYFLDKLEDGVWRLEIMPDVAWVSDPFFVPTLEKEVAVLKNQEQGIKIILQNLGENFKILSLSADKSYERIAEKGAFTIRPGVYLLTKDGKTTTWKSSDKWKNIKIGEYYASDREMFKPHVVHSPKVEVTTKSPLEIKAKVVTPFTPEKVEVVIVKIGGGESIQMHQSHTFEYSAVVPEKYLQQEGVLKYYILVKNAERYLHFPGGDFYKGHVLDRRIYSDDVSLMEQKPYSVRIVSPEQAITLFDADRDWEYITKADRNNKVHLVASDIPGKSKMQIQAIGLQKGEHDFSFRSHFAAVISGRRFDLINKKTLVVRASALNSKQCTVRVSLVQKDGSAFGTTVHLQPEVSEVEIALDELKPMNIALIPRPYPQFLPYWSHTNADSVLDINKVESIQFSMGDGLNELERKEKHGIALEWVILK